RRRRIEHAPLQEVVLRGELDLKLESDRLNRNAAESLVQVLLQIVVTQLLGRLTTDGPRWALGQPAEANVVLNSLLIDPLECVQGVVPVVAIARKELHAPICPEASPRLAMLEQERNQLQLV